MAKRDLFILCYNVVILTRVNNYSKETFDIFSSLIENDYNIKINADEIYRYFQNMRAKLKNEKEFILDFFKTNNIEISNVSELVYKLRIADRNELRIDKKLKETLEKLKVEYRLILLCNAIEEIGLREISYFKLYNYFDNIIFSNEYFTLEVSDEFKKQYADKNIILTEKELYLIK